ncbi:RagB/SusD family nutrient uptake outer membrane protein [Hymenobacter sp. BT770]|uniref:RagB/SusD family nutrient uptake outer membrane protein n=1 Tax=Hymenobacter sp. BT770 TaxID=2886942 RepID=UPI001D130481|nr:RagB/SusD family nutrient uptake outer membrane protein [Hymenobacter sp. BT770]MCC3153485.1 RagB/SusD family nutrient uptake outer membrane protein [Hymenobacter sp. BT770]MDO3415722.1 RagB/SusD family nutrient uptake outer membrane protein [Hymenobacter sp. BT770]
MKQVLSRGLTALTLSTALVSLSTSCTKDLDQTPKYELTPDKVYTGLTGYKQVLAKLYGGFALTGSSGPGSGDISGIDAGTSDYIRQWWSAQELTTDEAVIAWNDPGVQEWHKMNWDASDPLTRGFYSRLYYEIAICNEFLREATDDKLSSRLGGGELEQGKLFRAEARFLRAVAYSHVIDLFGNGPFVTENDPVGGPLPKYATRQELYSFVESELLALTKDMAAPRTNEYGRVDQAAAHGMLARLYLNAGVYTGTPQYAKAAAEAKAVIDAGYTLNTTPATPVASAYGRLFLADNNLAPAKNEIIWPVIFDANSVQSYGGTTFLVNGSTSGADAAWQRLVGQTTGWGGVRTTSALFDKFFLAGGDTARDRRGRFYTKGQTLAINDLSQFTQGLGVLKYRNVTSTGTPQGGPGNFSSVDFPMLRLADMMLIYAEAATRGNGDRATALGYVNQIRRRAFGLPIATASAVADISDAQMTTDFILDERARELHWEGTRRTDLIRYGKFTDATYLWPWKGGVAGGKAVDVKYRLFPLPAADLTANPNLKQNPGY